MEPRGEHRTPAQKAWAGVMVTNISVAIVLTSVVSCLTLSMLLGPGTTLAPQRGPLTLPGGSRREEEGGILLSAGCCQVLANDPQTPAIKSARYTLTFVKSSHGLFPDFSITKSLLSPVLLNLSSLSLLSKVPLSDVMGREPQNRLALHLCSLP